ncbi:Hemicentin-2 [Pseudolycoriella hygida]|uniref:Hemicentin-2 n=1 Tax=Pseudolycoriella hygida TaxID=35572 RepID=A0A9Q0RZH9_9DIPT|nr:Hemicentin-2 [Pseudolycoriella hygida]
MKSHFSPQMTKVGVSDLKHLVFRLRITRNRHPHLMIQMLVISQQKVVGVSGAFGMSDKLFLELCFPCCDTLTERVVPVRLIWAALTKDVELPCDVTSPIPNDSAKLVLWFKDSTGIPLYSLDSRGGGSLKLATHSALASDLGQRVFFSAEDNPKDARLQIRNVKESDGGVFRCRVDFFNAATRNTRVNLSLVVPPEEPRIFDAQGKEISHIAGPFREGHELFLSCQVTGGRPQPKVTWWRDGVEIAGTSHPSADEGNPAMLNQLFISTVTRDYYGSKLECRAQGSNLIGAVVKEITVQIKIVSANDLLIAGKSVPLRCETWGSFPPAKVTWLLDGEPIRNADITAHSDNSPDGNMTVSILNLKVSSENDGAELICRAANPWFSGDPPTVSVHLANEDPSRVVTRSERENVTLKCRADARPPVVSYSWFKNDMRMSGENTETLHLTQLQRESGGNYACGAQNSEETPEPPKSCELRNDTILEVVCVAGYDGGLTQHFLLEVVGGNPIYSTEVTRVGQDIIDNEISTMNDQATTAPLRRLKETIPEFKLHDLEPGREYQFLVYSVNAKGRSQPPVIMNGRIYGDTQGPHDETSQLEDPTPAETSNQDKQKQSTMIILAAVVAAGAVVITSIIVTGIVVVCKHRPKPPEPQEVRKRMRS